MLRYFNVSIPFPVFFRVCFTFLVRSASFRDVRSERFQHLVVSFFSPFVPSSTLQETRFFPILSNTRRLRFAPKIPPVPRTGYG
jgi:hypothetical protein